MKKNKILELYKLKQTVFTLSEIAIIWQEKNSQNLKSKIKYYIDKQDLFRIRRGIYAKNNYNEFELAVKIYKPSYISFQTVLKQAGIIFQYYEKIFVASYLSREIKLINKAIDYHKIKNEVLLNSGGVMQEEGYAIASPERAFLDMIYLYEDYYFDNLRSIDWDKCFKLVEIYDHKNMEKRLKNYYQKYVELEKA